MGKIISRLLSSGTKKSAPYISSFTPNYGTSTSVTILGKGLIDVISVNFGGTAAANYSIIQQIGQDPQIIAVSPSSFSDGYITVTSSYGTATSVSKYYQTGMSAAITCGDFESPVISTNSFSSLTSFNVWSGSFIISNGSSGYGITPYAGNQCCLLQLASYVSQAVTGVAGNYTLSFYLCGRSGLGPNPINILLNGTVIQTISQSSIGNSTWALFTVSLTLTGNDIIEFQGAQSTVDWTTAIDNVVLTKV
jgi:hypothetical protein